MGNRIPLPLLPGEFRRRDAKPVKPYRAFLTAAMDARIPADRDNGRWSVDEDDLPQIAEVLDMELPPRQPADADHLITTPEAAQKLRVSAAVTTPRSSATKRRSADLTSAASERVALPAAYPQPGEPTPRAIGRRRAPTLPSAA